MSEAACPRCGAPVLPDTGVCPRCFVDAVRDAGPVDLRGHAPPPPEAENAPPERRFGRYTCIARLGEGAMGEVWKAWDHEMARTVALKLVKGEDFRMLDRFHRERRIGGTLAHPNIAALYDAGEARGRHFIAMQYVEGATADDLPAKSPRELAAVLRDAARAVAFAHEHGVVHRDLKPANLMVEAATGRVYVMDFGLARRLDADDKLSRTGEIVGTPNFMSPEQVRGADPDPRTDVYGLGATFYAMLTGRPPFEADTIAGLFARLVFSDAVPPTRLRPGLGRDLETITLKCLEKSPDRRYATSGDLADDLDRYLRGDAIRARPPSLVYRLGKAVRKQRTVLAAAGATAAVAFAAYWFGVHRPAARIEAEDRSALRRAVADKRALEGRFRSHLERGELDDAVALARRLDGRRPDPPELRRPALLKEPGFEELARPYAVSLSRAHLDRARRRLAEGDARGRADLANAYRTGRDRPHGRVHAREALHRLAALLLADGAFARSEATARLAGAQFGLDATTRAALARAAQRTGKLEEAASLWHSLASDPSRGAEARTAAAFLDLFLPRTRLPGLGGTPRCADLDGDGRFEVVDPEDDAVRVLRPAGDRWEEVARHPVGTDGDTRAVRVFLPDGGPDIVALAVGRERPGALAVFRWEGERLVPRGRARAAGDVVGAGMFDVDGDGAGELFLRSEWPDNHLTFFRRDGSSLARWFRWDLGARIIAAAPAGPGKLAVRLSEWRVATRERPLFRVGDDATHLDRRTDAPEPWGFRVFVLERGPDGAYREGASSPDRFAEGSRLDPDGDGFWVHSYTRNSTRRVVPAARDGLYHIPWDGAALGAAVRSRVEHGHAVLGAAMLDGRRYRLVVTRGGTCHAVPERGETLVAQTGPLRAVDRGDAAVFWYPGSQETLLCGLGRFEPAPPREPAAAAVATRGELTPGRELLAIGLYAEAAAALEAALADGDGRRARYDLGVALTNLGRWAEAAEAFGRAAADRTLAVDALMRQAHAIEHARDWPQLEACLRRLARLPGADALAREWAERRLGWSRSAGEYRGAVAVDDWSRAALFVRNPLKARLDGGDLRVWATGERLDEPAGALVRYTGGSLQARFRVDFGTVEWATGLGVGLRRIDDAAVAQSPGFRVEWSAYGASDQPAPAVWLRAHTPPARGSARRLDPAGHAAEDGASYAVTFVYIPGLERVFLDLVREGGGTQRVSVDLPAPLEPGTYVVGLAGRRGSGDGEGSFLSGARLGPVGLRTASAVPAEPRVLTAAQWVAVGNGHVVAGRREAADEAYARAAALGLERPLRMRVSMFRGLAALRAGDQDAARRHLAAAAEADREAALGLLAYRRAPALTDAERAFLLRNLQD